MDFKDNKSPFIILKKFWQIFFSSLDGFDANKSIMTGVYPSDYY